ncbi:hypothetical protein Tco_0848845 [Tanacetum coccineum]
MFYTRLTKLIIAYFLSCNKNIPQRSNSKMHSEGDDLHITKLSNTIEGKFKFGREIPDTMIDDAFKKTTGFTYYKAKKVESEKAKAVEEREEENVSPVRSGRGKCYMHLGEYEANVLKLFKKNVVPRKTRSLTVVEETVAADLAKSVSSLTSSDLRLKNLKAVFYQQRKICKRYAEDTPSLGLQKSTSDACQLLEGKLVSEVQISSNM